MIYKKLTWQQRRIKWWREKRNRIVGKLEQEKPELNPIDRLNAANQMAGPCPGEGKKAQKKYRQSRRYISYKKRLAAKKKIRKEKRIKNRQVVSDCKRDIINKRIFISIDDL